MKISFRKVLVALAAALPVLFFASCTSDLEPEVIAADGFIYSQDEFDSLVAAGELDTNGRAIGTAMSSGKVSSSSELISSDSKSSSSGAVEASSSSVADTTVASSSSVEEKSSSSEEEEEPESSSSSVAESSSSYEAVWGEGGPGKAIIAKDGILSIGTEGMSEVKEDDTEALDGVKAVVDGEAENLPEGFSDFGLESTTEEFNYEAFLENQFFCLTKEASWLEVSRSKLGEHIGHFKNNAALGPLEDFKVSFADACSAVYAKQ